MGHDLWLRELADHGMPTGVAWVGTWDMLSLHAVLELAWHMPCHHYMQFWSVQGICHAIIKCSFGAFGAHATFSATISCYFGLLYIT